MGKDPENVNPTPQIEEIPKPQISGPPAGQSLDPPTGLSVTLEDVLASPELQEYIKKEVQSKTDSRLGTYGTRLDTVEGTIAQYNALLKSGMTDPQALAAINRDVEFQNMKSTVETLQSGNVPAPSPGGGEQTWENQEATILDRDGIKKDDPRLIQLLRDNTYPSHDEYVKDLNENSFAWRQADAKKPVPSPGTVAQITPAVPAGDGTYTAEKYTQDMLAAQGKPSEVRRIKAAAKADGVDVDNIGFGT